MGSAREVETLRNTKKGEERLIVPGVIGCEELLLISGLSRVEKGGLVGEISKKNMTQNEDERVRRESGLLRRWT